MNQTPNPQIDLAYDYVKLTNKHIFLTGKAGTGKTTFLRRIRKEIQKRMAVVAPTGVAAINAEGVTIHSLFQLPFGPLPPKQAEQQIKHARFSRRKIDLIRSLDLLIIDEISMVRADVLDAIDMVLRRFRISKRPFGGLQLLMIGDLHQLPPVVKSEEWELLRPHYQTPYFFGSLALKDADAVTIELKHIYRQADNTFIDLLNKVRNNKMTSEVLDSLNSRYVSNFKYDDSSDYITLTSHNYTAKNINEQKLDELSSKVHTFSAFIDGDFPKHAYPTEEELVLKKNAQVMFVKNDTSEDRRYYNGKIGRITNIKGDSIFVQCPDDDEEIEVGKVEWHNRKYALNEATKEVDEKLIGTFTQYPLKLAWAITIHKSQGLTFERVIIDAKDAFAHGQVYVALSRCKTFEGIILRSKLENRSVKTDLVVKDYTEEAQQNEPGPEELKVAKKTYQGDLLQEYFSFNVLKIRNYQFNRFILENDRSLHGNLPSEVEELTELISQKVLNVGQKFLPHLKEYLAESELPEENDALIARLKKAGSYFKDTLNELFQGIEKLEILTDNKEVKKKAKERKEDLKRELFINIRCANALSQNFNSLSFAQIAINADLDYQKVKVSRPKPSKSPQNIEHPELYKRLAIWRKKTAEEREIELYQILTTRSALEITAMLPTSIANLKQVHGIGKGRAKEFGEDILQIVSQYCQEHKLESDLIKAPERRPKKKREDTKAISMEMFKNGKTIEEIAKKRGFVASTIENHLAHYVTTGELNIIELFEADQITEISTYFLNAKSVNLSDAKAHFGEKYSYGQLRLVRAHLKLDGRE